MRKISFIFYALILLLSKQAFSQTLFYDLFAKEGTEWSVGERSSINPPEQITEVFFLKLQGEETVNDTTYHRLVRINEFNGVETGIHSYLRIDEDSCLFLRDIHGNQEKLFDYSMTVGDSIYIDFWVYRGIIQYDVSGGGFIKLNNISSVQINGETKTKWETQIGDWTQDLGSTIFMLDVFQLGFGYTGYETELLCVFLNGTQLYHTPNLPFCDLTSLSTIKINKTINIYPNPANEVLSVINYSNQKYKFNIINILGEEVFCGYMEWGTNVYDIRNLMNGTYILKIGNETFLFIKK